MYRNDAGVIRHRNAYRNEKSINAPGRFPAAIPTRRPLLHPCGRPLGNRFPQQTFRPFTQNPRMLGPRIEHPNMNFNCQRPQNFPRAFIPPHSERCEFPRNNFGNLPPNEFSPIPSRMTGGLEMKSSNYGVIVPPVFNYPEELWIETMSENGRIYYYNANSRATTWDKPENVKIMSFMQLKALASSQYNGQAHNNIMQNREDISTPMNGCSERVPPVQNLNAPSRLLVFPPPTLYTPPPFFTSPSPATNYNMPQIPINQSNPPSVFHIAEMTATSALDEKTNIQSLTGDAANPATMDNKNKIIAITPQNNQINFSEQQEKAMLFSELQSRKFESCRENKENIIKCKDEQSPVEVPNKFSISMEEDNSISNISQNVECIQDSKDKIEVNTVSIDEEDKLKRSSSDFLSDTISEGVENSEKSRPISSTPIPGSQWCVVWTGDSKVFFYDAYRKVSVWNTPEELIYREEVKKLIESPPIILEKNQENISSGSYPKKIKIEVKNAPAVSEYPLSYSDEQPTIQEIVSKATKEREDIPHETRVQMFMEMLSEKKVSAFSTWEKELHKIVFDSRYLLLAPKERKHKFEAYVHAKIEEEKKCRQREIATKKENYTRLLEEAVVSQNTRFPDFAHKYAKDSRFKAIDRTREKERLFNMFIHNLHRTASQNSSFEKQTSKFLELLKDQDCINVNSTWSEFKKKIAGDDRYLAVSSEARRESLFQDFIQKYFPRTSSNAKGKEERIIASIQTRRKEVERNLSACMKELEEGRLMYKHESLTNGFTALLVDLVRNPDMKYRDAIKCLKADHRWETVGDLRTNERERLFDDHIRQLKSRKKDHFYKLLDGLFKEIDLTSSWKDVKKTIRRDERCANFFSDEKKCEKEFYEYMKNRLKTAKEDFRELLTETKIITYSSNNLIKNTNHLENIENALAKDKRYLVLKCIESDRKKMLMAYIEDLYIQGPPPPPTASEPSRR